MRSFREIRFRLSQEIANAFLFVRPPTLSEKDVPGTSVIPPAPAFDGDVVGIAGQICEHRFPLLGYEIDAGQEIRWRRDYVHGVEGGLAYFRRVPYLDASRAGDHKIIWELNRHQHLVVLTHAWRKTQKRVFLDEIAAQLKSWFEQNPYGRGINWASALEVAFRSLSWLWIEQIAGPDLPREIRRAMGNALYQHGAYLQHNLSVYFSPNTHLLGEAMVLHALGAAFPHWPRASKWRAMGGRVVVEEMAKQVREDGSHFEQSSAYHVYTVDMFLLHARFATVDEAYRNKLGRMARYLAALMSEDGYLPLLGDDDGGNLYYPAGKQRRFGQATLARFGEGEPAAPVLFPEAGVAVLSHHPAHIVVDTKAFGHAGAGHSHAHALSVVCRYKGEDVLIDPGTYTYVGEPEWRARFRGTAFHNTVRIDGLDQATGAGPFRWIEKPDSQILQWKPGGDWTYLHAACSYRGLRHERHFLWLAAAETLAMVDLVSGAGVHTVEQFWHVGEGMADALSFPAGTQPEWVDGWRSEMPGAKSPAQVLCVRTKGELPIVLAALLVPGRMQKQEFDLEAKPDSILLRSEGGGRSLEFSPGKAPVVFWPAGLE